MLRINRSFSLPRCPIVVSSFSPIRASRFSQTYHPPSPILRISKSHCYQYSSVKRLKIFCFRHEESPPDNSKAEPIYQETEIRKPCNPKQDLVSKLREAAAAVRGTIDKPWTVPWSADTIWEVAYLFFTAFWFVGMWLVPFGAETLGFTRTTLTYHQVHVYSILVTEIIDHLAEAAILYYCLSSFCPLPPEWFRFSLKDNWLFDVIVGCLMFPLFRSLYQFNLDLVLHILPSFSVSNIEPSILQSIIERDPVVMTVYALVLVVCAPLSEEIIFRGFLLSSLTKYVPIRGAIVVSSAVFALLHWKIDRMLDTMFFGLVMGVIYTRSKNLLPSILLHGLWNLLCFLSLMRC